MALRTNATGENARRTTSLPAISAFTMCGWTKATKRVSAYQFQGAEGADPNTQWFLLGWDTGGNFMFTVPGGGTGSPVGPSDEEWFFWVLQNDGSGSTSRWYYQRGIGGTWEGGTLGQQTWTLNSLTIGNDSLDEWMNAASAYVRVWSAVLTASELQAERDSVTPVRTANLYCDLPLASNANDASGNGNNFTANGTVSYESQPAINQRVTSAAIASGSTLYALSTAYAVTPATLAAGSTLYVVVVSQGGALTVLAVSIAATSTLYAPAVIWTQTVVGASIVAGSTSFAATVEPTASVLAATIASASALYAMSISLGNDIARLSPESLHGLVEIGAGVLILDPGVPGTHVRWDYGSGWTDVDVIQPAHSFSVPFRPYAFTVKFEISYADGSADQYTFTVRVE